MTNPELPLPPHFRPERAGEIFRVPYEEIAAAAERFAAEHRLQPAAADGRRIALLGVDLQNTFCTPGFELYVGGRTGTGAVDDTRRLAAFIYRNLHRITQIICTLDTHSVYQIFHADFLIGRDGERPPPYTLVSVADVESGRWRFDPAAAPVLGITVEQGQRHLLHYTRALAASGKYELTIWPYHALLGGIGHALVPLLEEAVFFHTLARRTQADFRVKGDRPLTEHYSVLGPEVTTDADGWPIASRDDALIAHLLEFDAVLIAGQAKSHCVAWTIDDLLRGLEAADRTLAPKVYLLEDCTSPVVVPGVVDYTDAADAAFERFAAAGMHVVRSTDPMASWPDMEE